MASPIVFDIETGPSPDANQFAPVFDAPSNYKDPEKIKAYVDAKLTEWMEAAALSAVTGKVLAIGVRRDGVFEALISDDEAANLKAFWAMITKNGVIASRIIGFNSNRFDVPYLVRRSWKLGVTVPPMIMQGRYIHSAFIDIMDIYKCGDSQATIKLDTLARWLGVGEKNGSGADFAKTLATDKAKAVEYLANDLLITERCAIALGVMLQPEMYSAKTPEPLVETAQAAPAETDY